MQNAILVLHLLICMVLVGAVLMQRSEGGALGMGGGGTGGLISGRGAADMMVNITSWVGGAFFVTSLFLAVLANTQPTDRSVIRAPGERPAFQFSIPGFPKSEPKSATPTAALPAPAPVAAPPLQAPTPDEAVIRAAPLETLPTTPVGAASGPRTPPPAASLPAAKTPADATTTRPATSAAPSTARPVGSQKAATSAPMIPLPAATPPAPSAESAQPPSPAPAPDREKAGPDE